MAVRSKERRGLKWPSTVVDIVSKVVMLGPGGRYLAGSARWTLEIGQQTSGRTAGSRE